MRLRRLLLFPSCLILLVISLAVINWRPLVAHPLFLLVEDSLSAWVTRRLTELKPTDPSMQPPAVARHARVAAFEPAELIRLWQTGQDLPSGNCAILANAPHAYQWRPRPYQLWLLEASTEAAVSLGVDAVIDASAADRLRTTAAGRRTVRRLRAAGIPRVVLFDGGHHLPALILDPEIGILPVIGLRGTAYACHAHLRDAVPVPALEKAAARLALRTSFYTAPRLLTMAKTKNAMAALAMKALAAGDALCANAARGNGAAQAIAPTGLMTPYSALDLLLARAGWPLPKTAPKNGRPARKSREGGR